MQDQIPRLLLQPLPDASQISLEVAALARLHAGIRAGRATVAKQAKLAGDAPRCLLAPSGTAAALPGAEDRGAATRTACEVAGSSQWLTPWLANTGMGYRCLARGWSPSGRWLGSVHVSEDGDLCAAAFDTDTGEWLPQQALPLDEPEAEGEVPSSAQLCFNECESLAAACIDTTVLIFTFLGSHSKAWWLRVEGPCELRWISDTALAVLDCQPRALTMVKVDTAAEAAAAQEVKATWARLGSTGKNFEGALVCMDVLPGSLIAVVLVATSGTGRHVKAIFRLISFGDGVSTGVRSFQGRVGAPDSRLQEGESDARVFLAPDAIGIETGSTTTVYSLKDIGVLGSRRYRVALVSTGFSPGGHFLAGIVVFSGVPVLDARTGATLVRIPQGSFWTGWTSEFEKYETKLMVLSCAWGGPRSSQLHIKSMTANACAPSSPEGEDDIQYDPFDDPDFNDLIFTLVQLG